MLRSAAGSQLVLAASMLLCWLAACPSAASAHARLLRSDPPDPCAQFPALRPRQPGVDLPCDVGVVLAQPPRSLRLLFNERVQVTPRSVRVLGPSGRRVDHGPPRVSGQEVSIGVDGTERGTYQVLWRVVAADTHPAQGSFRFTVGAPSARPGDPAVRTGGAQRSAVGLALQALGRAIHLAGYALAFGVLAFRQAVLFPRSLPTGVSAEARVWRLVGGGILALLVAEPVALLAQTVSLSVPPESPFNLDVAADALDSSFGLVLAQRAGAAVLLWVLIGALRQGAVGEAAAAWGVLGLGVAVAFIDSEAAHAVGTRPAWVGFAANVLHESAMGWWIGAVLGLLAVWRQPGVRPRRDQLAAATARFAGPAVAVLVLSGTVMAVQHVPTLRDLFATPYGRTLAAKVCVLEGAIAAGWAAASSAPADRRGRWWSLEAALLLGALALAGLLVSLPPPI